VAARPRRGCDTNTMTTPAGRAPRSQTHGVLPPCRHRHGHQPDGSAGHRLACRSHRTGVYAGTGKEIAT
jgi:hypothetical protein